MALRAENEDWRKHLSSIGIADKYVTKYAKAFSEQEVPINLSKFIPDDELRDVYHIKLAGHRLAIRHGTEHTQLQQGTSSIIAPAATSFNKPQVRHKPPQLKPQMTPSSFRAFLSHWAVYKNLVGIPPDCQNSAAQLYSLACEDHPQLRQTIEDHNPETPGR